MEAFIADETCRIADSVRGCPRTRSRAARIHRTPTLAPSPGPARGGLEAARPQPPSRASGTGGLQVSWSHLKRIEEIWEDLQEIAYS